MEAAFAALTRTSDATSVDATKAVGRLRWGPPGLIDGKEGGYVAASRATVTGVCTADETFSAAKPMAWSVRAAASTWGGRSFGAMEREWYLMSTNPEVSVGG